jgi:hypothetical protein
MPAPAMKPAPTPQPARSKRMTLEAVTRGKRVEPLKVALYAPEGLGKSTFGSNAPSPIFLGTEDGTSHLDVARFPTPTSWQDILDAVQTLTEDEHDFRTLVVDTLDWMEPMVWEHVCKSSGVSGIEEVGGGFGKGYNAAVDVWRLFLAALERLRKAKGMHVLLLAHSWIRTFKNPQGEDYDRFEMKLHNKAAGLIKEWCDAVLFANHETYAAKDKAKRVRGVSTGARLIHTEHTAAYDAKNRHSLPESLPLSWADFQEAVERHQPADPEVLTQEILRKAKQVGLEAKVLEGLKRADGDAVKLAQLNVWLNAKLAEKEG